MTALYVVVCRDENGRAMSITKPLSYNEAADLAIKLETETQEQHWIVKSHE